MHLYCNSKWIESCWISHFDLLLHLHTIMYHMTTQWRKILAFSNNFCPIKIDLSGSTVWPQASGFQKLAKLTIFGIFDELLFTQNVNVAHFARNVEWDLFLWFSNTVHLKKDWWLLSTLLSFRVDLLSKNTHETLMTKNTHEILMT